MSTARKPLDDTAWLRLAASTDPAREVLNGIHVGTDRAATDSHRLHRVSGTGGLQPGIWNAKTFAPIEGTYPNYVQVIPGGEPTLEVSDLEGLLEIVAAAIAANREHGSPAHHLVTLPTLNGEHAAFNPSYLLDVLRGAAVKYGAAPPVHLLIPSPVQPMRVVIPLDRPGEAWREAVVMPVRQNPEGRAHPRFDLSEFVGPIEAKATAAAGSLKRPVRASCSAGRFLIAISAQWRYNYRYEHYRRR